MPSLSDFGNSDAVDSAYVNRAIVYVEAHGDGHVFERMLGMSATLRVAFKAPLADGGGCISVCKQVQAERDRGSNRTFGLLDGEAAATLGGWKDLVDSASPIFPITNQQGLYFLAEHELENLLLLHGDVCEFIVKDVKLTELEKRDLPEVEATLRNLTRRFIAAAILKYAALHLRSEGTLYKPPKIGEFKKLGFKLRPFLAKLEAQTKSDGLDWDRFRAQVSDIRQNVRARSRDSDMAAVGRDRYLLRLADGKGLLDRLRNQYNVSPNAEGHLVDNLVASPYAAVFRAEVLAAVAA